MVEHYVQFCEVLPHLDPGEEAWLKGQLEYVYVLEDGEVVAEEEPGTFSPPAEIEGRTIVWEGYRFLQDSEEAQVAAGDSNRGFDCAFQTDEVGTMGRCFRVFSEESGEPLYLARLVQRFLARFRPEECWSLSYAETCSKPCVREFGGGGIVVTATEVFVQTTGDYLDEVEHLVRSLGATEANRILSQRVASPQEGRPN
jgi:hypothetical protein